MLGLPVPPVETPPSCRKHLTDSEHALLDVLTRQAAALDEPAKRAALAERQRPPACWDWPVEDSHRTRTADDDGWGMLVEWQAGRCAICGGRSQFLDHDHLTGLIRGWLCPSCNTQEGFAPNTPGTTFAMYRERNPATMLGVTIVYYSPFTGWAEPADPNRGQFDGHAAYILAGRYGTGPAGND
jgi:hypothetical protein